MKIVKLRWRLRGGPSKDPLNLKFYQKCSHLNLIGHRFPQIFTDIYFFAFNILKICVHPWPKAISYTIKL